MATALGAAALALLTSALSVVEAANDVVIPPQKALLPAVHWNHNKADLQNLVPVDSHKLYYSTDGTSDPEFEHVFAHVNTKVAYPAVVLDHSQYIKSVQCEGKNLDIEFTDKNAYTFAKKAWAEAHDVVLVTNTNGCGTSSEQHTFWLIDDFVTGSCGTCITAVVDKEIATEDAFGEVDMVWGTYEPDKSASSRTRRSIAPVAGSSPLGTSSSGDSSRLRRWQSQKRQAAGAPAAGDCGPPSSPTIDGLPAATCNSSTFDQDLDDAIGYLDFDGENYSASLEDFMPGLNNYSIDDNGGFTPVSRLRRRFISAAAEYVAEKARQLFRSLLPKKFQELVNVAENLAKLVEAGLKKGVQVVNDALGVDKSVASQIPININAPNRNLGESPFGNSAQIYQQNFQAKEGQREGVLKLYCVGCGAQGLIRLSGHAKWTPKTGIEELNVGFNGSIQAGLSLGIVGSLDLAKSTTKEPLLPKQTLKAELLRQGVPGFYIPKVITVGPSVELAIEGEFSLALSGELLVGANMSIPDFAMYVDFKNPKNSKATGFTPKFTPNLKAGGSITATASLGLPVTMGLGIFVPVLKTSLAGSIGYKPAIEMAANYTLSSDADTPCNNGIGISRSFVQKVFVEVPKIKFDLVEDKKTVDSICWRLGSQPNAPASSLVPTVSTTPIAGTPRRALGQGSDVEKRQEAGVDGPGDFDFVTGPTGNSTVGDIEWEAANRTAFESLAATEEQANLSQVPFAPNADFVTITTLAGNNELAADEGTGNLYYADPGYGSLFGVLGGFVDGDVNGNFFHYYNDTMTKYNVSRFRFSNETHIPKSSDFLALTPINYDANNQTADIYIGLDTIGTIFYPVTCDIQDQASKAFLVKDVTQGIQTLQDPALRNTVTGGIVQSCYFLPWAAPPGSASVAASNDTASGPSPAEVSSAAAAAPPTFFQSEGGLFASLAAAAATATYSDDAVRSFSTASADTFVLSGPAATALVPAAASTAYTYSPPVGAATSAAPLATAGTAETSAAPAAAETSAALAPAASEA